MMCDWRSWVRRYVESTLGLMGLLLVREYVWEPVSVCV